MYKLGHPISPFRTSTRTPNGSSLNARVRWPDFHWSAPALGRQRSPPRQALSLITSQISVCSAAIVQVEKYAASVRGDERFRNVRATWEFWAISDGIDEYAKERIRNEEGLINDKPGFEIYVKTWSQVLNENRARLQFFKEKLEYQADRGSSLKHLREQYAKFLEGVVEDDAPAANDERDEEIKAGER